ncbi:MULTISPECIES: helix-turn-helix domain-containing protein, partial [unclassified Pseudarthrobacter]|uniref:helix-turn-helix domain-containing protein n=1 Tax=unclassified Pseudarthrobacter TaxID=2647000 RepID=UPI003642F4FD
MTKPVKGLTVNDWEKLFRYVLSPPRRALTCGGKFPNARSLLAANSPAGSGGRCNAWVIGGVVGRFGRPGVLREKVRVFWVSRSSGLSDEASAGLSGLSEGTVSRIVRKHGGVDPSLKPPCGRFLSFGVRELIGVWRAEGCGVREIARRLGRNPSTVSRE